MAVQLPNGIFWAIATAYAPTLNVSTASNANDAVLGVNNTLVAGDIVEYTSGWSRANGRLFRVKTPTTSTIVLEGLNSSDTTVFPVGSGGGSIRKVNTWQQIQQVLEMTSSGGEMQTTTYSFLEDDFDRSIPTTTSAQSLAGSIADDPSLPGQQALVVAAQSRRVTALRATLPQGGIILYNAIVSFDETPSMQKGNVMACAAGFALQGKPVRYSTT